MASANVTPQQTLAELNRRWMEAYTTGDIAFLEAHMAEDYVSTFPDGTVHDKRSEIAAVQTGEVNITKMEPKEMLVRVYDATAVCTGRSAITAVVDGRLLSADFRFTDVWVANEGRWQAVSSQVTRIEHPA
jgi:ketosteroid isomerase-like protein